MPKGRVLGEEKGSTSSFLVLAQFFYFFVIGVFLAMATELLQEKLIFVFHLIFGRDIVSAVADCADKTKFESCDFCCHNVRSIAYLDQTIKN